MQTILKDKTALVTGASRGLGRVISLALGHAGANVELADILIEGQDQEQQSGRWQRDLSVNLSGACNCCKAVWPGMVKKGWGRIIAEFNLEVQHPCGGLPLG